jgi:hypothetical protein
MKMVTLDTGHEKTDAWKIGRSQQEETMDRGSMQQQPLHMGSDHLQESSLRIKYSRVEQAICWPGWSGLPLYEELLIVVELRLEK